MRQHLYLVIDEKNNSKLHIFKAPLGIEREVSMIIDHYGQLPTVNDPESEEGESENCPQVIMRITAPVEDRDDIEVINVTDCDVEGVDEDDFYEVPRVHHD